MSDENISALCREFRRQGCHTVILYGSRAREDASAGSDYDMAGFRSSDETVRDTKPWSDGPLDLFFYPEKLLIEPSVDLLKLREGVILADDRNLAANFLARLKELHEAGPPRLPASEIEARRVWAGKMLERTRRCDAEGDYRRAWLLTALLEDYFCLRGLWYEGPKKGLEWLSQNDAMAHHALAKALKPGAAYDHIAAAVEAVVRIRSAS